MGSMLRRAWVGAAAPAPPGGGGGVGARAGLPPGPDGVGVGGFGLDPQAVPPSRVATANAIIKFLAQTQGTLPRSLRERGDLSRRPVKSPEFRFIWGPPNRDLRTAPMSFWVRAFAHLEGWNNVFVFRERFRSSMTGIDLIHPSRVKPYIEDGEKRFTLDGKSSPVYTADEILHIYGLSFDGVKGISPVAAGLATHQHAELLDRWGRQFLRRGSAPSLAFLTKEKMDDEAVDEFYDLYDEQFSGANNVGRPILLQGGNSVERLTIPPEEAQYLQSRQFTREEVLGFYGAVPHHLLGWRSNTSNFGTGLEQQNRHLWQHVLRSRLNLIQDAINAELLPPELVMEFSVKDFLRGDAKSQAEVYSKMRDRGTISREEWREESGFPPAGIPDDFIVDKNKVRLDADSGEPEPEPAAAAPMPPRQAVAELRCLNSDCASRSGNRPGKLLGRAVVQATIECPDCRQVTRWPPLSDKAAQYVADAVMAALERRPQPAVLPSGDDAG